MILCKILCRFGCNGACTINPLQRKFNESCNYFQKGRRPDGSDLGWIGAVVEGGADMQELVHLAGMKYHNAWMPCMSCNVTKPDFFKFQSCTMDSQHFDKRSSSAFLEELESKIVRVAVPDVEARDLLAGNTECLQAWPHGRAIKSPVVMHGTSLQTCSCQVTFALICRVWKLLLRHQSLCCCE